MHLLYPLVFLRFYYQNILLYLHQLLLNLCIAFLIFQKLLLLCILITLIQVFLVFLLILNFHQNCLLLLQNYQRFFRNNSFLLGEFDAKIIFISYSLFLFLKPNLIFLDVFHLQILYLAMCLIFLLLHLLLHSLLQVIIYLCHYEVLKTVQP